MREKELDPKTKKRVGGRWESAKQGIKLIKEGAEALGR